MRARPVAVALFLAVSLAAPASALADLVLPRVTARTVIEGPSHAIVRQALERRRDDRVWASDPGVAGALCAAVPAGFADGCQTMWRSIGAGPRGVRLVPVVLFTGQPAAAEPVPVLLAMRCVTIRPATASGESAFTVYDERLAYLAVGRTSSTLTLLPDPPSCGDMCAGHLTHVEPGEAVSIGGRPGISVVVSRLHHPCCDGPDSTEEERVVWYRFDGASARMVAAVLSSERASSTSVVDDGEFDSSESTYSATIRQGRDARGHVARIVVEHHRQTVREYRGTETREPPETGRQVLRWDARALRFEPWGQ